MNKQQFLSALCEGLRALPQEDANERVNFYSEIIDDKIEEGFCEEDAVSSVGSVSEIVSQIISETPITKLAKEKLKPKRRLKTVEIIFLVLGSPIWLSLLVAAFAVVLSVYVSLWSVIISLWSVFVSLAACSLGGIISAIIVLVNNFVPTGLSMLGAGLVCGGLSIFAFFACKAATKGIILLTKKFAKWIKNCFIRKEEV